MKLDDSGYIDIKSIPDGATLDEVNDFLRTERQRLEVTIKAYQQKLIALTSRLDCLDHSSRTAWLLFKDKS